MILIILPKLILSLHTQKSIVDEVRVTNKKKTRQLCMCAIIKIINLIVSPKVTDDENLFKMNSCAQLKRIFHFFFCLREKFNFSLAFVTKISDKMTFCSFLFQ